MSRENHSVLPTNFKNQIYPVAATFKLRTERSYAQGAHTSKRSHNPNRTKHFFFMMFSKIWYLRDRMASASNPIIKNDCVPACRDALKAATRCRNPKELQVTPQPKTARRLDPAINSTTFVYGSRCFVFFWPLFIEIQNILNGFLRIVRHEE